MKPILLDCTLRDGGYVNNWEFNNETALAIIDGLYDSGVRWIEIGIMGNDSLVGKQTKFSKISETRIFCLKKKKDCHYAVMVTATEFENHVFPICSDETPDVIRLAFFKPEFENCLEYARALKEKGYLVFLQAMATFMYDSEEMSYMIERINELKPYAFYMVDSFSTMYPNDVAEMRDYVLSLLDKDICFGFHAHNNIQMAYANVQEFLKKSSSSQLFVDGSIFGMGRGAGNAPTELLMTYLNNNFDGSYNVLNTLLLYENHLEEINKKYGWGYTLPYYLTAEKELNSAWGWFFMSNGVKAIRALEEAFSKVPDNMAYTLDFKIGTSILEELGLINV